MHRFIPLLVTALLVSVPACRQDDGLGRVEVQGKVTYEGAPLVHGLITFRPAKGSKGPATGTGIVDGKFVIPIEKGPTVGPHEVEVKIVDAKTDSASPENSTLTKRSPGSLKSFSERVEVTTGVNDFEFSFPLKQPNAENHASGGVRPK